MSRLPRRALVLALAAVLSLATAGDAGAQAPEASFATVDVVPVPISETLLGVTFADDAHGWAVGAFGTIMATTDGGATWHRQTSGVETARPGEEPGVLRSVSFADRAHGYAVGDSGLILVTSDGGTTWRASQAPPLSTVVGGGAGPVSGDLESGWNFRSVKALTPQSAYLVGLGGAILTTSDGGAAWQWRGNREFGHLSAVTFPDAQHGYAVPSQVPGGKPYFTLTTTDGGSTWAMRDGPSEHVAETFTTGFSAVSFPDVRRGFVAGAAGRILATSDGGNHWAVQRKDTTETFQGLAVAGTLAVAAGFTDFTGERKASLATTADGGETWVSRLVPGGILWNVAFANPSRAFAVGCAEVPPTSDEKLPCKRSLVARISFPGGSARGSEGGDGGRFGPAVLVGAAVVVVALGGVLIARRRCLEQH